MENAFGMLEDGVIGEVTQDNVTYATAPTPPDGDSSTKVATTAFVKGTTPTGNVAVWSRDFTIYNNTVRAPSGGSWFCWGVFQLRSSNGNTGDGVNVLGIFSGGATLGTSTGASNAGCYFIRNALMSIKIA